MPTEENSKHNDHKPDKPLLTQRERDIVILICRQYSNKQIAGMLNISPYTVETHKKSIREKTGSFTVVGFVLYAERNNIFINLLACLLSLFFSGDCPELLLADMA